MRTSIIKKIFYALCGVTLLVVVSAWVFFSYYFEAALNRYAVPRLTAATSVATHGKYTLTMGRISYIGGSVFCKNFVLSRAGYDSSEHGNAVKRISIDSVRFIGVSWWDALWGNDMRMTSIEMNAPKLYMSAVESETGMAKDLPMAKKTAFVAPKRFSMVSFDSIVLRDISVYLPNPSQDNTKPLFEHIELKLTNFQLDSKTVAAQPLLFSERVDFSLPACSYKLAGGDYSLELRNLRGSFSDSTLTMDTLAYQPLYSKQTFAAHYHYIQPRTELRCANVQIQGINFVTLIAGTHINFRTCAVQSFAVDSYYDLRGPTDPKPQRPMLPNDLVRAIHIPITIDSVILDKGMIHWGERWPKSVEPGTLAFTNTRITISPFCTDTQKAHFDAPTRIAYSTLFVGEALLHGTLLYSLHSKALNFDIDGAIGALNIKKLNTELMPIERIEATSGTLASGVVHITVRDGLATTMINPQYHDLKISVLSSDVHESRGFFEGLKTFLANTFSVHSNNMDSPDEKAKTATTTFRRTSDQEFLRFTWFALRKSLGKVVGFDTP